MIDKEQEKLDATQNDIDKMQVDINTARKTNAFYAKKETTLITRGFVMVKTILKTIGVICCFPIYGIGYVTGFWVNLLTRGYDDGEDRIDSNW